VWFVWFVDNPKGGAAPHGARRQSPFVAFVFFVVQKAWIPAFAGTSGD